MTIGSQSRLTIEEIFHHLEMAIVGGIMQRNVFQFVLAFGGTLIHRY